MIFSTANKSVIPAKAGIQLMEFLFTGSRVKPGMTGFLVLLFSILIPLLSFAQDSSDLHYNFGSEAATATIGRAVQEQEVATEINSHVWEVHQHTPVNAALRSALIPGWGQRFNGQKVKSALYFFTITGTLLGSVIQYRQSNDSHDAYLATGRVNDSLFDDHENERLQATILGVAGGLLYGFSIIDAYRNAYQPLWSKNISFDVVSTSHNDLTTRIRWEKKFQ